MAAIYLIRHGQASFGAADYDQLSAKGSAQARKLGEYWQQLTVPDKYYSGDLLRHSQTAEQFVKGIATSTKDADVKKTLPVITHSGFNEFNHVDVLTCYKPQWQDLEKMAESLIKSNDLETNKAFQIEFSNAINRWVSGEHDKDYQETWPQFKTRCIQALQDVIRQEINDKKIANNQHLNRGGEPVRDIVIFTSGGTISILVQHILTLTDQQTLMINQQMVNTGITKLLFSTNRLSLDYLNNYSHLSIAGDKWITYR